MTKEELEKATGQELIDARNYCGVDGYYGDYLENVNAEMLKRFNRLAELEEKLKHAEENCINKTCVVLKDKEDCVAKLLELEKENAELKGLVNQYKASKCSGISLANRNMIMSDQLVKAKEIIKEFVEWANWQGNSKCPSFKSIQDKAEQFLNEV